MITSKDDLPIVAFKYGPYTLGGYHPEIHIGKLKCKGNYTLMTLEFQITHQSGRQLPHII